MTQYEFECEAYGVAFRLSANRVSLLRMAAHRVPYGTVLKNFRPARIDGAAQFLLLELPDGEGYCLRLDGVPIGERRTLPEMLDCVGRDLMVHVANYAPELVFVHAGVVAWQGRALILPGPSFAGKTTLVAALVRAGAAYYSDEYAVVDADGRVHPYARNLQMRQPGETEQTGVSVGELGGVTDNVPLAAGYVVFCEYAADAQWQPEAVSAGMAVLEMLRHTIPVQRTPGRVMAALTAMIAGVPALRSQRGEADEAAQKLLALWGDGPA